MYNSNFKQEPNMFNMQWFEDLFENREEKITKKTIKALVSKNNKQILQEIDRLTRISELLIQAYKQIEAIPKEHIKKWIAEKPAIKKDEIIKIINNTVNKNKKILSIKKDEIAKMVGDIIDEKLKRFEITTAEKIYTTKIYSKENETITDAWRFKESRGIGKIEQILLKTDSDQFRIYFTIDDDVNYENTYTFFSNNSKYLSGVSAYLDGGFYYLSIQDLLFQKHFTLRIQPLTPTITFELIQIKYIIRDEVYLIE